MHVKRYRLKYVTNFRDIGGVVGKENKLVRWNTLFRSDKLEKVQSDEWNVLKDAGVKTVIDLRSLEEVATSPDNCPSDITYIRFPLVNEDLSFSNTASPAMQAFSKSISDGYKNIVLNHGENIAEVINIISDSIKMGGVVFHCTSGKDRTGIVASILYYLLGVDDEDIIADYQVSHTYNKKTFDLFLKKYPEHNILSEIVLSDAKNMEEMLELYKKLDIENYLIQRGLDREKLSELKEFTLI